MEFMRKRVKSRIKSYVRKPIQTYFYTQRSIQPASLLRKPKKSCQHQPFKEIFISYQFTVPQLQSYLLSVICSVTMSRYFSHSKAPLFPFHSKHYLKLYSHIALEEYCRRKGALFLSYVSQVILLLTPVQ